MRLFLVISSFLFATIVDASSPGSANPNFISLELSHIERGGIGYKQGYTSLSTNLFFKQITPKILSLLDIRAHYFDNGPWALNAGLGFRAPHPTYDLALGCNFYYDFRQTRHHSPFSQIGSGLEFLSPHLDIRLNGYFPITTSVLSSQEKWTIDETDFYIARNTVWISYTGFNLEFGILKRSLGSAKTYGALGPYYYGGKVPQKTWGGAARLNIDFKKNLCMQLSASYDEIFKTKLQFLISLKFPIRGRIPKTYLYLPVQRNEIIVLNKTDLWEWNF